MGEVVFKKTCSACPEQYDVFDETGKQIAYVRLRWGHLTVECPDVCGDLVYEAEPEGHGCFANEEERQRYFLEIRDAIVRHYSKED